MNDKIRTLVLFLNFTTLLYQHKLRAFDVVMTKYTAKMV